MNGISVVLTGDKTGIYVDPVTCIAYIDYRKCENFLIVDMTGVNCLVIYREKSGSCKIMQANGWTPERGLFCDNYN